MIADTLRLVAMLGAVVVVARVLGAIATRLRQPAVAGEILAGVLLGPTVLGLVTPTPAMDVICTIALVLLLLSAGLEVDLSTVRRQQRTAYAVGASGIVFPFALGFAVAWWAPDALSMDGSADPLCTAAFFGIAMSISALPVIVRTLMNLRLYRTDFGMTVVSAAVLDDMVGWGLFAALIARFKGGALPGPGIGWTVLAEVLLAVLLLTLVRRGADKLLSRIAPRAGAAVVAGAVAVLGLAVGALAHGLGGAAMFGAFFTGIAVGDSRHLPGRSRSIVSRSVELVGAPLFFGAVGLKVDFAQAFDLKLCVVVLVLACAAKVLGCSLGARMVGVPARRAWALGFAMNSRGAMEIALGVLALDAGIIGPRLLVALVVMALVTSIMAGPAITLLLGRAREEEVERRGDAADSTA